MNNTFEPSSAELDFYFLQNERKLKHERIVSLEKDLAFLRLKVCIQADTIKSLDAKLTTKEADIKDKDKTINAMCNEFPRDVAVATLKVEKKAEASLRFHMEMAKQDHGREMAKEKAAKESLEQRNEELEAKNARLERNYKVLADIKGADFDAEKAFAPWRV